MRSEVFSKLFSLILTIFLPARVPASNTPVPSPLSPRKLELFSGNPNSRRHSPFDNFKNLDLQILNLRFGVYLM